MALINKDTRIARYSAEEGVGWVPLVPGLETSPSFDKYLEETGYYINDYSDRDEDNLLRDSLLDPLGPVWDDMNEEFLLDLYEGWGHIPMVTPDTPVFAFVEGKAPTSAPLSKAISSPLIGGGETLALKVLREVADRRNIYVPSDATVYDVLNLISMATNSPLWALNCLLRTQSSQSGNQLTLGYHENQRESSWIAATHKSGYSCAFDLLDQDLRRDYGVNYVIVPDDDHTDYFYTSTKYRDKNMKIMRYKENGVVGDAIELLDLDGGNAYPNLHGCQPETRVPELLRLDKYLATMKNLPQGTQVPIAIYSTNKGDTITINGTRIPAFKIVAEDLYERCELYDRTDFRVMRQPIRSYSPFQLRPQFGKHILTPTPSGNAVLAHIQKQR
jgi:hypothetical protein